MVGTPAATVTRSLSMSETSAGGREVGTGHHQGGPGGDAGVGQAPGVGVEHGDDREDHVALTGAEAVGHHHAGGVQPGRPVAVDHALGVPGRARRVTHRRGLVLVADVELDRAGRGQQVLVVVDGHALGVGRQLAATVVHDHDVAHGAEGVDERPQQGEDRLVDEDDLVLGVVHDVGDLLGEQADVEGVHHPSAAGHAEVELEVPGGVPPERAHPPVGTHTEVVEHPAEASSAVRPTSP